ncbi:MAG: hypothetical protein M1537_04580 [Nitrospirae bacterium]|jgi:hypothetical protein|nr:hypothetical protein [Nitrospirota bacterium]
MAILPVVGLEQVIAQSPALVGERVREQKKEEGSPEESRKAVAREEQIPPSVAGVEAVHPVSPEEGLEKDGKSEYPPGRKRGRREPSSGPSGGAHQTGAESRRHRLDIEA